MIARILIAAILTLLLLASHVHADEIIGDGVRIEWHYFPIVRK